MSETAKPARWVFTFGSDVKHPVTGESMLRNYVLLEGTREETRRVMFDSGFNKDWAFQYHLEGPGGEGYGIAAGLAVIEEHGLQRVDLYTCQPKELVAPGDRKPMDRWHVEIWFDSNATKDQVERWFDPGTEHELLQGVAMSEIPQRHVSDKDLEVIVELVSEEQVTNEEFQEMCEQTDQWSTKEWVRFLQPWQIKGWLDGAREALEEEDAEGTAV